MHSDKRRITAARTYYDIARRHAESFHEYDRVRTALEKAPTSEEAFVERMQEIETNPETARWGGFLSCVCEVGDAAAAETAQTAEAAQSTASAVYGGDAQRQALLNAVQRAGTLSEAKGIVYGFRRMQDLGYELMDQSFQYGSGNGLDLVFQSAGCRVGQFRDPRGEGRPGSGQSLDL